MDSDAAASEWLSATERRPLPLLLLPGSWSDEVALVADAHQCNLPVREQLSGWGYTASFAARSGAPCISMALCASARAAGTLLRYELRGCARLAYRTPGAGSGRRQSLAPDDGA